MDIIAFEAKIVENYNNIIDLFKRQVVEDHFYVNQENLTIPDEATADYLEPVDFWLVPAGQTVDIAGHFSTIDNSGLANGLRATLYKVQSDNT